MNEKLEHLEKEIKKDTGLKYYKLCGAGGGGYFLIVTESPEISLESIEILIDNKGVEVWDV